MDEQTSGATDTGKIRLPLLEAVPMEFAWESLRAYGATVYIFASEMAVKVVARALAREPLFLEWWNDIRSRPAHFAAVGRATANAAARLLVLLHVSFPPNGKGLAATLDHLATQADPLHANAFDGRVVVFGAREGRASRPFAEANGPVRHLLAVPCYDLLPLSDNSSRIATLIKAHKHLMFECGAASIATALCDALPSPLPPGVKFLPRHASALVVLRARLGERAASSHVLPVQG